MSTGDGPAAPLPRHPFRFGVQVSSAPDAAAWTDTARKVEDLGFSVLTVADHLDDQFATTPALVAAADVTTTLRLGALVYANDYRHPVVLAKEAATVDLLSDGRLELGLGAGWMTTDYEQSGIRLDPPGTRIRRLEEALDVVRGLWADGVLDHDGPAYRIRGLDGRPKPVQRPGPPILIGGGGRRVLTMAARQADIIGLNFDLAAGRIDERAGPTGTAEATHRKLAWVREAAGDRLPELEIQARIHLATITDDRPALADTVSAVFGISPEEAMDCPHGLAGTVDEIVEQCHRNRDRFGISYITFSADALDDMAPVVARLAGR